MLGLHLSGRASVLFLFPNGAMAGANLGDCAKERQTKTMDVLKMLADLRREREQIEEAILTLERLSQGKSKRRGRPPGSKNKVKEIAAA